jgi:AcrR family transcriptional regulator
MPPKKKFDQDTVIEAAFQVLRKEGFQAVTARSVAQELGSSTTPIYWVLESMDKVEDALRLKTLEQIADFQARKYTDNVFINLAIGYVEFARQEPLLFRFMFQENKKPLNIQEKGLFNDTLKNMMGAEPPIGAYFGDIDQKSMDQLTFQSLIFTHGLATALSSNMIHFETEKDIEDLIMSAGSAFYMQQMSMKNNK